MTVLADPNVLQTADAKNRMGASRSSAWVHVVSHLDPKYGGLSAAVPALASAVTTESSSPSTIAGFCHTGEHFRPALAAGVEVKYFPLDRGEFSRHVAAGPDFRTLVTQAAGVHIHGLWQHSTSLAASCSKAIGRPYVVSAHGMLDRWALANKRLKKLIYAALVERPNLARAACLHALTESEADDYRRFGLRNPVAVIPNGVNIPNSVSTAPFFEQFPELQGRRIVLFLGRIHFKKGLDILCRAWAKVEAKWPDAQLVLAGPDFENTQARIQRLVAGLGVGHRTTFAGMLSGDMKWSALCAADCFVLPSYSEGLSVSVLEALGMGIPVVITEQCNLPEVGRHDCGWILQPDVKQIESALEEVLRASENRLRTIGANGRKLVEQRFSWARVGEQMNSLYEWMQGGPVPSRINLRGAVR